MNSKFDRDSLRDRFRTLSDVEQRIVLERVAEQLTDATLEPLLDKLVKLDARDPAGPQAPSLRERVEAHVAATRRGGFLGEFVLRNKHGQREPRETAAWDAATSHLFDVTLRRNRAAADEETLVCLRALVELVAEVDERVEELVVFEDSSARDGHAWAVEDARRVLDG